MFLNMEQSFIRKLKEAMLAVEIERAFSKDEILELYLNQVYFGSGAYGVEEASNLLRHAGCKLDLGQCALALRPARQSPHTIRPTTIPTAASGAAICSSRNSTRPARSPRATTQARHRGADHGDTPSAAPE